MVTELSLLVVDREFSKKSVAVDRLAGKIRGEELRKSVVWWLKSKLAS
ncbi:hypothetical protein H4F17_18000 [Vibrio cholerae]